MNTELKLKVNKDDLNYDTACNAYRGVSFDPEIRAKQEQDDYYNDITSTFEEFGKHAKTEEEKKILISEMSRYKASNLSRRLNILNAKARTISPMITGSANFPVARNNKRLNIEMKRVNEFLEWQKKAKKAIAKKLGIIKSNVISGDDPEAIKKLTEKIEKLENFQAEMKTINRILRGKKTSLDEKKQELKEAGVKLSDKVVDEFSKPYQGVIGFPRYKLTNNNANIKRLKARLVDIEKLKGLGTSTEEVNGVKVIQNTEASRIQIVFDGKPEFDVRRKLKSNGFRWSPKNGAWQRKLNNSSIWTAKNIVQTL
jgi:hypothetical protein